MQFRAAGVKTQSRRCYTDTQTWSAGKTAVGKTPLERNSLFLSVLPPWGMKFFWIIFKTSVRTSQETQYVSATKPNRLMLFRETVAVYCENHTEHTPTTVGARSKAWTVFACSNAGIVSSNPTPGMDVCILLFCVCVVLCVGRGLATGWSRVQGVLPTGYRLGNWKKR
jgi:hypothetical protein